MSADNFPGLFDKPATVLKPEGAPVAADLAEAHLVEEIFQARNLAAYAVGRPLKRDAATASDNDFSQVSKYT